jgi:hypothetical protein
MNIIIKKIKDNDYQLIVYNVFNQVLYSFNFNNLKNIYDYLYKIIDNKKFDKKTKCIHFIDFIKPITVIKSINCKIPKTDRFLKRYNHIDSFKDNYIERKVIASNFLKLFKNTKNIYYYYLSLVYKNKYRDYGKNLYCIDNEIKTDNLSLFHNGFNQDIYY